MVQDIISVSELPVEIQFEIQSYLKPEELLNYKLVCRAWNTQIQNNPAYLRHYGEKTREWKQLWEHQVSLRREGMLTGGVVTFFGIAALSSGVLLPAALIGGGVASLMYSYKSPVEKFSVKENFANMGIGAVSSVVTGAMGLAGPALFGRSLFEKTIIARIANQVTAQLTGTVANKCLRGEKIDGKSLAISAASSLVGASASCGLDKFAEPAADDVADVVIREFCIGATSSSVGQVSKNVLEKKNWNENLDEVLFFGGISQAIAGANRYQNRKEYAAFRQKMIDNLPQSLQQQKMDLDQASQKYFEMVNPQFKNEGQDFIPDPSMPEIYEQKRGYGEAIDRNWQQILSQQQAFAQNIENYVNYMEYLDRTCGADIDRAVSCGCILKETQFDGDRDAMLRYLSEGGELHFYWRLRDDPARFDNSVIPCNGDWEYWIKTYLKRGYVTMDPCSGNVEAMLSLLREKGELVFYQMGTVKAEQPFNFAGSSL